MQRKVTYTVTIEFDCEDPATTIDHNSLIWMLKDQLKAFQNANMLGLAATPYSPAKVDSVDVILPTNKCPTVASKVFQ